MGDTTLCAMGYPVFNDNHSKQETPESTEWSSPLIKVEISGRKRVKRMEYVELQGCRVSTRQAVGKLAGRPLFTVTFWMPDSLCDGTHLTGLARPTKHQQSTSPEIFQRWPTPNAKLNPENNH